MSIWQSLRPRPANLRLWQVGVLVLLFVFWYLMTTPGLIPPLFFDNDRQAAFFFGEPLKVAGRIWVWFVGQGDIYRHLWITLVETLLAFAAGSTLGLLFGLWLALQPMASAILEPYITALNSMPMDPSSRAGLTMTGNWRSWEKSSRPLKLLAKVGVRTP